MASVGTSLELRSVAIPRGPIIALLEREMGRPLTHETRHYLADEPVHCGDLLEFFADGQWTLARYEWTGNPSVRPCLFWRRDAGNSERVIPITEDCLLRWPSND